MVSDGLMVEEVMEKWRLRRQQLAAKATYFLHVIFRWLEDVLFCIAVFLFCCFKSRPL